MLKEFKAFLLRGNVVDLAVAVVIGAAFGAVVTAFTTDLLNPLIAALVGKPDFSAYMLTLNGSKIQFGLFLNALISFLLIAAAVYFFVVAPMNAILKRMNAQAPPVAPTTRKCSECASEIPLEARRCAHCCVALEQARGASS
ncbi:MAG TPA: large conductance mechanosensitive channel protein MscL [Terriglobales bacterium]|nr:large conductance mechanosensitive channel protein MscL [Terriglobales bacterium]